MQAQFCDKESHTQNQLNVVCLDSDCIHKGLICSSCLIEDHGSHVNRCTPLKNVFQALNRVNNQKTKEDLSEVGDRIRKKHLELTSQFRRYIASLQASILALEQTIDSKMNELIAESQLFVGNLLETSMEKLNNASVTAPEIRKEFDKLLPLLQISPSNPKEVECLNPSQKKREADRISKLAETLEVECKFWMEKSLVDLEKLKLNIEMATRKRTIPKESEIRFGGVREGWSLSQTDAISFQINKQEDVWLRGFGMFEVKRVIDASKPANNNLPLNVAVRLIEGCSLAANGSTGATKVILEECIRLDHLEADERHIIRLNFLNVVKLQRDTKYTISIKLSDRCTSFYGYNGFSESRDFIYYDTSFPKPNQSNSTSTIHGQFPLFYIEE